MIFRRVMLVVLPLLAVGFIFTVMWYLYQGWERSLVQRHEPHVEGGGERPAGQVEMETVGQVGHEISTDVNLTRKDRSGRTELRFLADRIEHLRKETADIRRPRLQFFTKQGEIITLLAEQGRIVTKGALMNVSDIRSGRLWGNVVLVHDRGTPDEYADDLLVALDDLRFDNQTYSMATDGPVLMVGDEMTLSARKMRLALDRQTRRIRTMKFLEDILITFEAGRRLRVSLTRPAPGEEAGAEAPPPPAPAEGTAGTQGPGENRDGRKAARRRAGGRPGAPDAQGAADAESSPADEPGDLWRIDLEGDVDAKQENQRLRCRILSLYNRTGEGEGGIGPGPASEAGEKPAPPPPDRPPGGSPSAPKPRPPDGRSTPSSPIPSEPKETGADKAPSGLTPLMTIVADGPLTLTPVGQEARRSLGEEVDLVTAEGKPVVVEDEQTLILGHTVRYNTRTGAGTVVGGENPMRLQQPGRLRLSGERLEFDRTAATARVIGKGSLEARTQGTVLAGSPAAGTGKEPSSEEPPEERLEAEWQRGMSLLFYRLPTDAAEGLGEIKQAQFHGQAVVKQADGLLQGDDLTIDFYPARDEKGQAVRRLLGHGDVKLNNAAVGGVGSGRDGEARQVGDIASEDLDIRFHRDATGAVRPSRLDAAGDVVINDPKGKIRAQELAVTFAPSEEGGTEARFLEARGQVLIDRDDLFAEGEHVRRDTEAGTLLLEGAPARARQGDSRIVGPRIRFSREQGRAVVTGAGELEVPATTDLRGRPRDEPEPLLVRWSEDMFFSDKRNFARFNGNAVALTGGTELNCQRLWVHFADAPDEPAGEEASAASPESPTSSAAEEKPDVSAGSPDEGLQRLFGRKRLIRILAEEDVTAVDQRLEDGGGVRHRMEIMGQNLTYLEQNRKAYMHGPGRLRLLAAQRAGKETGGEEKLLPPDAVADYWDGNGPPGYARTKVSWADSMAYDGVGNRAYFQGDVEARHLGRGAPGARRRERRRPVDTRITAGDLQVVFAERETAADATAPSEEQMTVEKLVANGNVLLWVDDRRGAGERLVYQRDPQLIRIYRGAGPGQWARLWQQNEATQEFGQIVARTITYDPVTGRVDVRDQQTMTFSPEP